MNKHLTCKERIKRSKTSRRKENKSGAGLIETMRQHFRDFKKAGLIPDVHTGSKEFAEQLPIYAKNWRN